MIETLTTFATTNGFAFLYGEREAFNVAADRQQKTSTVLYHKGYMTGSSVTDSQGAVETTYSLVLNILLKSEFADNPANRLPRFDAIELIKDKLIQYLSRNYELSTVSFRDGINQTDMNLDGIEMTFTAKSKQTKSYC